MLCLLREVRIPISVTFPVTDSAGSCHIIWNHSAPVASLGNRLDFCGIVLLMWGASLPSIHFGFICQPLYRYIHWLLVRVTGSVVSGQADTLCRYR